MRADDRHVEHTLYYCKLIGTDLWIEHDISVDIYYKQTICHTFDFNNYGVKVVQLNIQISQGNAATDLKWGGAFRSSL